MIDSLSDVERIEVLKGAQGGLYGRNATAGVINIITRKPSMNGFSGDFVGSYGDRNSINLGGYVTVPLSDTLAWTLSAQRTAHDAYIKNTAPDTHSSASNFPDEIGRASCRERECQKVKISVVAVSLKKKQQ